MAEQKINVRTRDGVVHGTKTIDEILSEFSELQLKREQFFVHTGDRVVHDTKSIDKILSEFSELQLKREQLEHGSPYEV